MEIAKGISPETIRTKTNLLPEAIDHSYLEILQQLFRGEITPEEYKTRCVGFFKPLLNDGTFDEFANIAMSQNEELELLRRHLDHCRYTVVMYKVDEGEVHPPHSHFNVVSTQIVARGSIRIREYERVKRDGEGKLLLKLVNDTNLREGDIFQASEWNRNVHWFRAENGPALIFNTNARGFEPSVFEPDDGNFGRRYVDPTDFDDDGYAVCEEFDKEEAIRRFGGRPLDDFPVNQDTSAPTGRRA